MKATTHGGRGRRRTKDEIRSILRRHDDSGLSLLGFARQHGLCYATLRRWRAIHEGFVPRPKAPGEAPPPRFVPVELEPPPGTGEFVLEWSPGRSLRIPAGFDSDQLRRLLDVLGMRP